MHQEILNKDQKAILESFAFTKRKFTLVGGTALALQIGHRESIDFDFFSGEKLSLKIIDNNLSRNKIQRVFVKNDQNYSLVYNSVKLTFFHFPFSLKKYIISDFKYFNTLDILTIGAMKAYALGRRTKWKDYVDLFFILNQFSLNEVILRAQDIFSDQFSPTLFVDQLGYFNDIDYSESVSFTKQSFEIDEIHKFLAGQAKNI